MNYNSLDYLIWAAKTDKKPQSHLTDAQVESFVALFGYRCRAATVERLRRKLRLPLSLFPRFGIFDRVWVYADRVEYVAGQDYGSEITTVRHCLLAW